VAVGFVVADVRLTDRQLLDRYGGPISRRIAAGGWLFFTLNVVFLLTEPGVTTAELFGGLRWATVVGSGAGFVVGLSRARAIQSAVEAERNAVRADMLESQRDVLTYLNSLLRHEVLNGTNVITGYAKLLEEMEDPETEEHDLETDDSGTTATVTLPVPDATDGGVETGERPGDERQTEPDRLTATVE
jgi:signal transduction histidine kinase